MARLSHGIMYVGGSSGEFFAHHIVEAANGAWYAFFIDTGGNLFWRKSADKGRTWGILPALIDGSVLRLDVWYDRWTPGDTGDIIHVAWIESSSDDVLMLNFNAATDTPGSIVPVKADGVSYTGSDVEITITKTVGGNVVIIGRGDVSSEFFALKAASPWTTFAAITALPQAATLDQYFAMPGNYADTNDFDVWFVDAANNGFSRQTYDDSATTWAETAIIADAGMVDGAVYFPQINGTIDGDGLQYIFAWNAVDAAGADLQCWTWDGATLDARANVITNSDDCVAVACGLDDNGRLYAIYLGIEGGAQTAGTSLGIYYKYSDDQGDTWSAQQVLFNAYLDDLRYITCSMRFVREMPALWFNDDTFDLITTAYDPLQPRANISVGI